MECIEVHLSGKFAIRLFVTEKTSYRIRVVASMQFGHNHNHLSFSFVCYSSHQI
jgi:hypothetical protein